MELLQKNGLKIVEQNYRCRTGEVDLIAREGRTLVFVEVKYRKNAYTGGALGAVTPQKQHTIARVAQYYLLTHAGRTDVPCRFDVVGFDGGQIQWIKNAFEAR